MPSANRAAEARKAPVRILVVCLESSVARVRKALNRHAAANWERDGVIRILTVRKPFQGFRSENSQRIAASAPRDQAARVIVLDSVLHNENFGHGRDLRVLNELPSHSSFEHALPSILVQSRLDWRSAIAERLNAWYHGVIDSIHLDAWLAQFERMGMLWLGERLLRGLDFWDPARLKLAVTLDGLPDAFDCLCVNRLRPGKSADFLANLFSKHVKARYPRFPIEDFFEVLSDPSKQQKYRRILFLEDCLLSGTEMTNFLSALLNIPSASGRPWKISPLPNPAALPRLECEMRFAVATSLGVWRLRQFLADHGLDTLRVVVSETGMIEALQPAGTQALEAGLFYEDSPANCPRDVAAHIDPAALRGDWRDDAQRASAVAFLRDVGGQLFRSYLSRANYDWPAKKVVTCELGMHGLGLNLAFGHSVPKASLPLFWMDGPVVFSGGTIQWLALFPNAAF